MSATAGVWGAQGLGDADGLVLDRARDGDCDAYGQLWRRHLPSAYAVANRYRGRASAEDIVGEASLRVYDRIRAGTGPTSNFRSYFLSTVKTVAIDLTRAELRLVPTQPEELEDAAAAMEPYNPALRVDQDLVRVAFGRLTEREQQLLWRTTVEGTPATVLAPTMGLSANAVRVAALRARDALRGHYLDAHADQAVQRAHSDECRWVLSRMGRYVRDDLRASQRARIERHLQQCRHANVVLTELTEVNRALPALIVPVIFLGGTASAALWAATGLAAGTGHGDRPTAGAEHSTGPAVSVATATSSTLAKVSAMVAAGALSAALVTTPTGGVGPAIADRDHTQQASGSSPRTDPSDPALGTSPAQPAAPADSTPTASTGPALVTVPAAPDNPPDPSPQAPAPSLTADGAGTTGATPSGAAVADSAPKLTTTTGSTSTHPVTTSGPSRPSNRPSPGTPTPTTPTTPTPGTPTPPPGLRGLSTAMANVAAQNPKANSNALTALQNAAARLTDNQSPPPP